VEPSWHVLGRTLPFYHFYFCVDIKQCSFVWRQLLQLNEKVKLFGCFTTNGAVIIFCWDKHYASKSNCVVWVDTYEHLRNLAVWGIREWGLDFSSVCLSLLNTNVLLPLRSLSINQGIQNWCYTQFHLLTSSTPRLWQHSVQTPLPLIFWPCYTSQQYLSLVIDNRYWNSTVMLKVQYRIKLNTNMTDILLKSCPCFLFLCYTVSIHQWGFHNVSYTEYLGL
jgi:hypothetical protein